MKNIIIFIFLITLPALSIGQNVTNNTVKQNDINKVEVVTKLQASEIQTASSTSAKASVHELSYKKSNELISIKAYRKSLQIKVKEIKIC